MKKISIPFLIIPVAILFFASCEDNTKPGWVYMPDMAYSVAYETYSENPNFADDQTNRLPVKGTIPLYQGVIGVMNNFKPYPYSNSKTGYDSAGMYLHNPVPLTAENLEEGHRLFDIDCSPCHGKTGKADGSIVVNDKLLNPFPAPPTYFTKELLALQEGNMFHSVHYGKNLMGSYSTQLDQHQIWMVIHYIRSLQTNYVDSIKATGGVLTASIDSVIKK